MGIPSYFAYIAKNYHKLMKPKKVVSQVDYFYMDCNSLIYDVIHKIKIGPQEKGTTGIYYDGNVYNDNKDELDTMIIRNVIEKIRGYLNEVKPVGMTYLAFDGVAPRAKMEQQRTRRYKTWMTSAVFSEQARESGSITSIWETAAITPGTQFMTKLSLSLQAEFDQTPSQSPSGPKIILSTSDEAGEGEHKLFRHIRENGKKDGTTTVVYGLDADLIMLSMLHLEYCSSLYLYRETPHYIQKFNTALDENEIYFVDIMALTNYIVNDMVYPQQQQQQQQQQKRSTELVYNNSAKSLMDFVRDYVFLCFLLGNDFMPHFPSLNIRTSGIDHVVGTYCFLYRQQNGRFQLIKDGRPYWPHVSLLITALAGNERNRILSELMDRDRLEGRLKNMSTATPKEKEDKFNNIPVIDRTLEKYISPANTGWEQRYYRTLHNIPREEKLVGEICANYVEGLDWVYRYYTGDCPDWNWKYRSHYPPLLADLKNYIATTTLSTGVRVSDCPGSCPVHPLVQLAFVMPGPYLEKMVDPALAHGLMLRFPGWFPGYDDLNFVWVFCRYFWESHVKFDNKEEEEKEIIDYVMNYIRSKTT